MSIAGELRACFLCGLFVGVVVQGNPHAARRKCPGDRTTDAA